MFRKVKNTLNFLGINIGQGRRNLNSLRSYNKDLSKFKYQLANNSEFPLGEKRPIFEDKLSDGGTMSGHYFHQDLHVAKKVYQNNPVKHVDIGSRVDGFVAHVAVFRAIEIFDIRPIKSKVKNIKFIQSDFMKLDAGLVNYTDSISSLHALEHFGLGRYNDPIDAFGHIKGFDSIYQCLKKDGTFYFSTPIGPQRVEFNAHRVFDISYLLKLFNNKYKINSFSYVDDAGNFYENIELTDDRIKNNFGCNYGCGIFEMIKL